MSECFCRMPGSHDEACTEINRLRTELRVYEQAGLKSELVQKWLGAADAVSKSIEKYPDDETEDDEALVGLSVALRSAWKYLDEANKRLKSLAIHDECAARIIELAKERDEIDSIRSAEKRWRIAAEKELSVLREKVEESRCD